MSSFYVNSGSHPVDFSNVQTSLSNLSAEEFARHIKEVYSLAKVNLTQVAEDMKWYYNRAAGESWEYAVGEKVFRKGRNIKMARPTKKMEDK